MLWRRAKSEGWSGGFGPHVHVFPPWESTVARPEGTSRRHTVGKKNCLPSADHEPFSVFVSFVGRDIKRTVPEDRRHETKHSHRGPVWKLPRYIGWSCTFGWSDRVLMRLSCLHSWLLFCVLQRRWPPTYDTWDGWTSSKNQTMNICGLCSLNCLSVKATPSTTRTTGSADR